MSDPERNQHGGRRAGAGRKPTLKPLSVLRLVDLQIREQLAELTAHQREASGNPLLSQEQVVAMLIQRAHEQQIQTQSSQAKVTSPTSPSSPLETPDNQDGRPSAGTNPMPGSAAIAQLRGDIRTLLDTLRRKNSVRQREGRRLIALVTELIPLHAAQVMPCAVLEELDRGHADDADRDLAIARLLEQPLAEYRQESWERDLGVYGAQLATGPIRRQAEQWALINLVVEVSSAAMITNDRSAELAGRLLAKGIDPARWLVLAAQRPPPLESPVVFE